MINWGNKDIIKRGPICSGPYQSKNKNTIGNYYGQYSIYRAISHSVGLIKPDFKPNLLNTGPLVNIGPFEEWYDPSKIITFDPHGHTVYTDFKNLIDKNPGIYPTIAITQATLNIPEINSKIKNNEIEIDNNIVISADQVRVTKAAIDPVWNLEEIAKRLKISEEKLRSSLFEYTGGMFKELIDRPDLKIFLPPIDGTTIYIFGDVNLLKNKNTKITMRSHDECSGSDIFSSDICTCRPYLTYAIEECIKDSQKGGLGIIIYSRKEGRSLGEVTKYLVYNARKTQKCGDNSSQYFDNTKSVCGLEDARHQIFLPDYIHWLGITEIEKFISMSDEKYNAIINAGIKIKNRISIPKNYIPRDAGVEIHAKILKGYNASDELKSIYNSSAVTIGKKY